MSLKSLKSVLRRHGPDPMYLMMATAGNMKKTDRMTHLRTSFGSQPGSPLAMGDGCVVGCGTDSSWPNPGDLLGVGAFSGAVVRTGAGVLPALLGLGPLPALSFSTQSLRRDSICFPASFSKRESGSSPGGFFGLIINVSLAALSR